ncbi:MAG TPA: hypothetical protein VFZ70_16120 [Euzebyales bacterium]
MMTEPDRHERARGNGSRDPWANAPTSELGDQVLPRWFVLTAIAAALAATAVAVVAFASIGRDDLPAAQRRPPPDPNFTTAVGAVDVGTAEPVPYDAACARLDGVRVAGSEADRARLRRGLAAVCNTDLPAGTAAAVTDFAEDRGVVRFATFEATGVDSTASLPDGPPVILINTRYQRTDAAWIAPLIAHDATLRALEPGSATAALAAREAEATVCDRLLGDDSGSRSCADARAVLTLDDPLAALRGAGFE